MGLAIGVLGDGNMGSRFRDGLTTAGHQVRAVGRDPAAITAVIRSAPIVILALPYWVVRDVVRAHAAELDGKIVIDISNPLDPEKNFAGPPTGSGLDLLRAIAPGARWAKAFNTVFQDSLVGGRLDGIPLTAFVASDDVEAKAIATQLALDLGLEPVDAGGLENVRWVEALGVLTIRLGPVIGWDHGIRLVRSGLPGTDSSRSK